MTVLVMSPVTVELDFVAALDTTTAM